MKFTVEQVSIREKPAGPFTQISVYYRIHGVPSPAQVAMYRTGATLIDCGAPQVAQALLDHGILDGVTQVLMTHHHEDHVALAAEAGRRGIPTFAPEVCQQHIQHAPQIPLYRAVYWGQPESAPQVQSIPYGAHIKTQHGQLQVLHTPGHTPAHAAFVLEEGTDTWVVSGDVFLGEQPLQVFYETSIPDWIASCERILALPGTIHLLPAHGSIRMDGRAAVQALHTYLTAQAEAIKQACESYDTLDPCTIAQHLYQYDPAAADHSGGEINPACFVRGLLDPVRSLPASIPCPRS